jgi:hypothetical protein
MVTRIASRKLLIGSSTRSAQDGELALLREENVKMKKLIETYAR